MPRNGVGVNGGCCGVEVVRTEADGRLSLTLQTGDEVGYANFWVYRSSNNKWALAASTTITILAP